MNEEAEPVKAEDGSDAVKSRKERLTGSTHFGDTDFYEETPEEIGDATWGEVARACCCHTPKEWGVIFVGVIVLCFFLYFFLLGLELLGSAAKVVGGCTAGAILGGETNPIAALMIGILATVISRRETYLIFVRPEGIALSKPRAEKREPSERYVALG